MKLNINRIFLYFLTALLLLNLLQSHLTELLFDEAYYWHYASKLAWGYFDHPPMVALLVKISSLFFNGELGVRFMSCVLSAGTLVLLWMMIDSVKKQKFIPHFFALAFSMTLLNAYGFFTLPDTPLLFFTAFFLLLYKRFLEKESIPVAIGLGLVMAALMYSKYHAVLVILFVLASNLKLVLKPYAWLAVGVALLSYTPHILWLFENDFVSIRYHLFERPNRAYDFNDFTLGYFINLIALFGLTFPWIYMALFKTRPLNLFYRSLLFLVWGILLFFFVSSFQRRVQTQWIIVICIPLVILVFNYLLEHPAYRKWIMRMAIANVIVIIYLRLGLIYQPLSPIIFETHGNKEWVSEVKSYAGDLPVIFENSYREAPMYAFYSGNLSYSLNNLYYRENQYNIDGSEELVRGRKVLYVTKWSKEGDISYTNAKGDLIYGKFIDDFESFRELECTVEHTRKPSLGDSLMLKVYNPYNENIPLKKLRFGIAFMNGYKQVKDVSQIQVIPLNQGIQTLKVKDSTTFLFKLPEVKVEGMEYFKVCISENGLIWGLNGKNVKLDAWSQ